MNKTFKAGDLVFEINTHSGVELTTLSATIDNTFSVQGSSIFYLSDGRRGPYAAIPSLLHATQEMREKLVAIWGEDAVPKLPVRGSELTKKLLEKQKYGLCYVSDINDGDCRENKRVSVIERFEDGYFYKGKVNGPFVCSWKYAVPIDNNGNEITEIEE